MSDIYKNNITHLNFILDNLRKEDLEEVIAVYGNDWKDKVIHSTINTTFLTLTKNNIPIAVGGFVPHPENNKIACVWLLCSKFALNNKFLLLKELKTQLNLISSEFDILYNFIYKSNFKSISWIKKLGFKFDNPHPDGISMSADFNFFYKTN